MLHQRNRRILALRFHDHDPIDRLICLVKTDKSVLGFKNLGFSPKEHTLVLRGDVVTETEGGINYRLV